MAAQTSHVINTRRDWAGAFRAVRHLLRDPNDTPQVFRIMAALNGGTAAKNYQRLLRTEEGGRIAYRRQELVEILTDREFLNRFEPGTVGAAYRGFLDATGFSAEGLADVSREVNGQRRLDHPYAWFGRRERDLHDIWHVLTGYKANDPLGELCLVAFSYAQTNGLGWGFIALSGMLKSLREVNGKLVRRAVREGYAHGRAAKWLHLEDIESLFAEPIETARARLNIAHPDAYLAAKAAGADMQGTAQTASA
ncbi:MAG: ubiquinone biosynthesis protein [Proteobacteria bacterium]|nr:ubiquinone biosynthesis protein [Pseudomonadota bacterium]